jgi:hypothetical protein
MLKYLYLGSCGRKICKCIAEVCFVTTVICYYYSFSYY